MDKAFLVEPCPAAFGPRKNILALGSDTRLRLAWSERGRVFTLCPRRDIKDIPDFYKTAGRFLRRRLRPRMIAYDPHPNFIVKDVAAEWQQDLFPKARLAPVWHHVAHVSHRAFEEKGGDFIGVAFDGTGFGADAAVWGGEFFVYRSRERCFRRAGHFAYLPLLGGEKAVLEPWRMGLACALDTMGPRVLDDRPLFLKDKPAAALRFLEQMMRRNAGSVMTSSAGRLFDAASAILGLVSGPSGEAQAAIALEKEAVKFSGEARPYPFDIVAAGDGFEVDTKRTFRALLADVRKRRARPAAAASFHETIAAVIAQVTGLLRKKYKIRDVYLSGGVFMNDVLCRGVGRRLAVARMRFSFAPRPATTDWGIAPGQIAALHLGELCV